MEIAISPGGHPDLGGDSIDIQSIGLKVAIPNPAGGSLGVGTVVSGSGSFAGEGTFL